MSEQLKPNLTVVDNSRSADRVRLLSRRWCRRLALSRHRFVAAGVDVAVVDPTIVVPLELVPEVGSPIRALDLAAVGVALQGDGGSGVHLADLGVLSPSAVTDIDVADVGCVEHRRCHLRRRRLRGRGDGGEPQGGEEYGCDGGQPPLGAGRREER